MTVYKCTICDTLFDEDKENRKWDQLEADWACFVCESGKSLWQPMASGKIEAPQIIQILDFRWEAGPAQCA